MSRLTRCHTNKPSPYLVKNWHLLLFPPPHQERTPEEVEQLNVVDLGGGNGRNSLFLGTKGVPHHTIVDREGDFGISFDFEDLPDTLLPFDSGTADIVLVNYVFMLLPYHTRLALVDEISRITKSTGTVMVELQWLPNNEDCMAKTREDAGEMADELIEDFAQFSWTVLHRSAYRFIMQKG